MQNTNQEKNKQISRQMSRWHRFDSQDAINQATVDRILAAAKERATKDFANGIPNETAAQNAFADEWMPDAAICVRMMRIPAVHGWLSELSFLPLPQHACVYEAIGAAYMNAYDEIARVAS